MVKRISKQEVVQGAPIVISKDNPDAMFLKDNPNVVFKEGSKFLTSTYTAGAFDVSLNNPTVSDPSLTIPTVPPIIALDVPNLADIEKVDFEEYYDAVSGLSKFKAIVKIRNTSSNKKDVIGVDARIYNPNGASNYTFTTQTASTASAVSNYVSNVTWYEAKTVYDPFEGTIITATAVVSNAQYPSDGTGVPADSVTGPAKYRTKIAWRKTEQEAIDAATVTL